MKKIIKKDKQIIKEKARSYFWQQKISEVIMFILIASSIILIPLAIGNLVTHGGYKCVDFPNQTSYSASEDFCNEEGGFYKKINEIEIWFWGLASLVAIVVFLVIIIFMIYMGYLELKDWIKSNKRKAYKRALEERGYKTDRIYWEREIDKKIKEVEK